jgi:hypothetical protein
MNMEFEYLIVRVLLKLFMHDGDLEINTQYSPGPFTIRRPSTLILKNVN